MSITISIKKGEKEHDVVIPVEWKDMTIKYFSDLSAIIQRHHKKSKENKEEVNDASTKDIQLSEIESLKMLQNRQIAEDKLEQEDDHAKMRASVSLAKDGIKQMQATIKQGEM